MICPAPGNCGLRLFNTGQDTPRNSVFFSADHILESNKSDTYVRNGTVEGLSNQRGGPSAEGSSQSYFGVKKKLRLDSGLKLIYPPQVPVTARHFQDLIDKKCQRPRAGSTARRMCSPTKFRHPDALPSGAIPRFSVCVPTEWSRAHRQFRPMCLQLEIRSLVSPIRLKPCYEIRKNV